MSEQTNDQDLNTTPDHDLENLKAQADLLNIDYHPNIGYAKLKERIAEVMDNQEQSVPVPKGETKDERRRRKHAEAMQLVRCQIVCNDPSKREWPGEWIGVSNGAGVSIRKLVPYNQPDKPFHLPRILVNALREKQVQVFVSKKGKYDIPVRVSKMIQAYSIVELPPLTEQELKALSLSQQRRGALDERDPAQDF